ncbi:MAG: cupredoxin domain-containing protein [Gemmatimonadota bacterium]
MSGADVVVVVLTVATIAWVNWYFFMSEKTQARASAAGGMQEVRLVVKGGYEPNTVRAIAGVRLRLVFDRQEASGCSEELVIPAFGVKRYLPAYEETVVEIMPSHAGEYEFTCGMSMLRGRLIVEDPA